MIGRESTRDKSRVCVAVALPCTFKKMPAPGLIRYFRCALGSPVGGGAWSVAAGGPSSSVRIGFSPSAQT